MIETNRMIPCICKNCNNPEMAEVHYSDISDSYILECPECSHELYLHFTAFDSLMGNYDEEPISYIEGGTNHDL